jgi:hypothetical protein
MNRAMLTLALCLCPAAPVVADPCAGVRDLLSFIAAESDYALMTDCPKVERSDALDNSAALRSQVGAYVPATGQILLASDLDTDSLVGRSYLLHELVHAAQYRAGRHLLVACEAELEAEAYHLQTTWLRRQGEFREAMLLDWAAQSLGRCEGAVAAMDY